VLLLLHRHLKYQFHQLKIARLIAQTTLLFAESNEAMTEVNGFLISVSAKKDLEKLQSLTGLLSADLDEKERGIRRS